MIEWNLEFSGRKENNGTSKNIGKYNKFSSPLKISKLCLMVEIKIITLMWF